MFQKGIYPPSSSNTAAKAKHSAPKKDNTLKNIRYFLLVLRYPANANNDKSTIP